MQEQAVVDIDKMIEVLEDFDYEVRSMRDRLGMLVSGLERVVGEVGTFRSVGAVMNLVGLVRKVMEDFDRMSRVVSQAMHSL